MSPRFALSVLAAALLAMPFLSGTAGATSLSVLTYNTEGVNAAAVTRAPLIADEIEVFRTSSSNSIVHLQEVFSDAQYTLVTDAGYAHVTPRDTGGFQDAGSGLVTLSDTEPMGFQQISYTNCAGTDCLIPKGFTVARHEVEPGVFVDIYNTHTNASGSGDEGPTARRAQLGELADYINTNSVGVPLILFGDTNSRWTEMEDDWQTFVDGAGLSEVWIELPRMGDIPDFGPSIKEGCPPPEGNATPNTGTASGPTCEIIDKILWRDGGLVELTPTAYAALENFVDDGMPPEPLSDHLAISATFDITVIPEPATALQLALGLAALRLASRRRRQLR